MFASRPAKLSALALPIFISITSVVFFFSSLSPSYANGREENANLILFDTLFNVEQDFIDDLTNRVAEAGSYGFVADIEQLQVPAATAENVGRPVKRDRWYLEGNTDLNGGAIDFYLWANGGSVLNRADGLEVSITPERAMWRQDQSPWEEINDFSGTFAPGGDFLAFLSSAENITLLDSDLALGGEIHRYSFTINSQLFATKIRDDIERQRHRTGELPAGVSLGIPEQFAKMDAAGELWLDSRGLPVRQKVSLQFPEQEGENGHLQALIDVTFSKYGEPFQNVSPVLQDGIARSSAGIPSFSASSTPLFLAMGLSVLLLALSLQNQAKLQLFLALVLIFVMLTQPFFSQSQLYAYYEREEVRQAEAADRSAESDMHAFLRQSMEAEIEMKGGNLETPSAWVDSTTHQPQAEERQSDDGADSDGDGLTDFQEELLGTNPNAADSDGDLITDTLEIRGLPDSQGKLWQTDPLEPDSNRDGIGDGIEWSGWETDGILPDLDGDGTPDTHDFDNDADGVPDKLDLSPFTAISETFTGENPLSLIVSDLITGHQTTVKFQLRPTNPDHLWYALNVFDWPKGDESGQMQDIDGRTFADYCTAGPSQECDSHEKAGDGDLRFVPMLKIRIDAESDLIPSAAELAQVGGSLFLTPTQSGHIEAYLPLQLIIDNDGGNRVAFQGSMIYNPSSAAWGEAHQVSLVWVLQALVDRKGETDAATQLNRLGVIHTYNDDWELTGLSVREEHGVDMALAMTDPAAPPDALPLQDSELLTQPVLDPLLTRFALGLDRTLLAEGSVRDGERNLRVSDLADLFDSRNPARSAQTSDWLLVEARSYETVQKAMLNVVVTETKQLLDGYATPAWSAESPISPTILFAREERFRTLNLDTIALGSQDALGSLAGNQLRLNLSQQLSQENECDTTCIPIQTWVGVNWAPYQFDSAAKTWHSMQIADYWDEISKRNRVNFAAEPDPDVAAGKELAIQLYYLGLYNGTGITLDPKTPIVLDRSNIDGKLVLTGATEIANILVNNFEPTLEMILTEIKDAILIFGNFSSSSKVIWEYFGDLRGNFAGVNPSAPRSAFRATVPFSTVDDVTPNIYRSMQNAFKWLHGKVGTVTSVGVAVVAMALVVTAMALLIAEFINNDPAAQIGLAIVAGVVLTGLQVIVPLIAFIRTVRLGIAAGFSIGASIRAALSVSAEIVSVSRAANIFGLVLAVGIAVGFFIYLWASGNIRPGSVQFNAVFAQTSASVIVSLAIFAAIAVIGAAAALAVAIVGIIDLVLLILCGVDKIKAGECFTFTGALIEGITKIIHSYELMVVPEIETVNSSLAFTEEQKGFVEGNHLIVETDIQTALNVQTPSDIRIIAFKETGIIYTPEQLRQTSIIHEVGTSKKELAARSGTMVNHWRGNQRRLTLPDRHAVIHTPLTAGINQVPPAYLNTGLSLAAAECWVVVCYSRSIDSSNSSSFGIVVDVFPDKITEFYAYDWSTWEIHGFSINPLPEPVDWDGDGLRNDGGQDPDDKMWDTDGDGLSDRYEINHQLNQDKNGALLSPENPDSDSDGLDDLFEIRLGTDPGSVDSDRDGLSDWEEAEGYTFTLNVETGETVHIFSDPTAADGDGDGMSDLVEKELHLADPDLFPFHPNVFNLRPVTLQTILSDEDGIIPVGSSVEFEAIVHNNVQTSGSNATGILTVTLPLSLTTADLVTASITTFDLEPKNSISYATSLQSDLEQESFNTEILNQLDAVLQDPQTAFTETVAIPLTIDGDRPTSTISSLTDGQYFNPEFSPLVSGQATDPTSRVQAVSVRFNRGDCADQWQSTFGSSVWIYSWFNAADNQGNHCEHPTEDGSLQIESRAIDVVGNVEEVAPPIRVILDQQPPNPTFDATQDQFFPATQTEFGEWIVVLHGSVSDPQAGSESGSGVQAVSLKAADSSGDIDSPIGWQPARIDGNRWEISLTLPSPPPTLTETIDLFPSGGYTVALSAVDAIGNELEAPVILPIKVDHRPPEVELVTLTSAQRVVSQTINLTGRVTEPVPFSSGIDQVQLAFTPADQAQAAPESWSLAQLASSREPTSTWTFEVPSGLEGLYQIDLRGVDNVGNFVRSRAEWNVWRGEIDTLAPRVAVSRTFSGFGSSAQTTFFAHSEDFNLTADGYDFVCPLEAKDEISWSEPWWNEVISDTTRLSQFESSCRISGFDLARQPIQTCDRYGRCTTDSLSPLNRLPANFVTPTLHAAVLTPTHETILAVDDPLMIEVGVWAPESAQGLTFTIDSTPQIMTFAQGELTDGIEQFEWEPKTEGVYQLSASVSDWSGRVQTETLTSEISIDLNPPTISITDDLLNLDDSFGGSRVNLNGTVFDSVGVAQVEVKVGNGTWQPASIGSDQTTWTFPWYFELDQLPNGTRFDVFARVFDVAGRSSITSKSILVDVVPPEPAPLQVEYRDSARWLPAEPDRPIDIIDPELRVGLSQAIELDQDNRYQVGWSTTLTPSTGTEIDRETSTIFTNLPEAQPVYIHLLIVDRSGNQTRQTTGPFMIDSPLTPDFISDRDYLGWANSGGSLIETNSRIERITSLNKQTLHASWDDNALRLLWSGTDWSVQGDLFYYFDVNPAMGTTKSYDPYGLGPNIALPADLKADFVIMIEDGSNGMILRWEETDWVEHLPLPPEWLNQTIFNREQVLDLSLPFSALNIEQPNSTLIKLLAVGTEEEQLQIWTTMPGRNPLNSSRTNNPAGGINISAVDFALTRFYEWPNLGSAVLPNKGSVQNHDLSLTGSSNISPDSIAYRSDSLLQLQPGESIDDNLDGVFNRYTPPLPFDFGSNTHPTKKPINYRFELTNHASETARGLVLNLEARGPAELAGGSDGQLQIPIDQLAAGETKRFSVDLLINAEPGEDVTIELIASLQDDTSIPFDSVWQLHQLSLTEAAPSPNLVSPSPTTLIDIPAFSLKQGAMIELRTIPKGIVRRSEVEWQDRSGRWHRVDGWVVDSHPDHTTEWWVAPEDLGTGPFRWVGYRQIGFSPSVISQPFMLPNHHGQRRIVLIRK